MTCIIAYISQKILSLDVHGWNLDHGNFLITKILGLYTVHTLYEEYSLYCYTCKQYTAYRSHIPSYIIATLKYHKVTNLCVRFRNSHSLAKLRLTAVTDSTS